MVLRFHPRRCGLGGVRRWVWGVLLQTAAIAAVAAPPSTLELSLRQAMGLAVTHHVQVRMAREQAGEASAQAEEVRAALRPNIGFSSYQLRQTQNLRAMGLNIPGLPIINGPFDTFDARVQFSQQIFDLMHQRQADSALTGVEIAHLNTQVQSQHVAGAAGLAYLAVQETGEMVKAAQANEVLSSHILQLTLDQEKAGLATGVDEVRARTAEAQNQYALHQAEGAAAEAGTRLRRALGIALGTSLVLTDPLTLEAMPPEDPQAVAKALQQRPEVQALEKTVAQRTTDKAAAVAADYPTLGLVGAIGPSGVTPTQYDYRTYSYGVQLALPIYQGGALAARQDQAESRRRQAQLALRDGQQQVEEDVRLAQVSLVTARAQAEAADSRVDLAQRLLEQAQDRFASGIADNLELVDAQAGLAQARSDRIGSLGAWRMARINYDLALGQLTYDVPATDGEIDP